MTGPAPSKDDPDERSRIKAELLRLIPWTLAVGFAAIAAWLGQSLLISRDEAVSLRTESRLADLALRNAENQLKAERIILSRQLANSNGQIEAARKQLADATGAANSRVAGPDQQAGMQDVNGGLTIFLLVPPAGNASSARGAAAWNPVRHEGILTVENLPALPRDQEYRLWIVDPKYPDPLDGGTFTVDAAGGARIPFKTDQPVFAPGTLVVSCERKGGVAHAEGPVALRSR